MAVIELTKENFDKEVIECDKPVLIDFWASWCAPCRMLSPTVDEIAEVLAYGQEKGIDMGGVIFGKGTEEAGNPEHGRNPGAGGSQPGGEEQPPQDD